MPSGIEGRRLVFSFRETRSVIVYHKSGILSTGVGGFCFLVFAFGVYFDLIVR